MNLMRLMAAALVTGLLLVGCGAENSQHSAAAPDNWPKAPTAWAERLTDSNGLVALATEKPRWLVSEEGMGLRLLDEQGQSLTTLNGRFELLDAKPVADSHLALTLSNDSNQPWLVEVRADQLRVPQVLPVLPFHPEGLCLYRADGDHLYGFFLHPQGGTEQWLLRGPEPVAPARVRTLPTPMGAEYCAVDDARGDLYLSEEGVGLWRFGADPESEADRELLAAVAPVGQLMAPVGAVAVQDSGLWLVAGDVLHVLHWRDGRWRLAQRLALAGAEVEALALRANDTTDWPLVMLDDASGGLLRAVVASVPVRPQPATLPVVLPSAETAPVRRFGDAADDPAIWIHPQQPAASRVLGTDKQWGLLVYDLDGNQRQALPVGRVNNVDVRQGIITPWGQRDIAVASNRSDNSVAVFDIDPATGTVSPLGSVPTPLAEVYGICAGRTDDDQLQLWINDKDGRYLHYQLHWTEDDANPVRGELLHRFSLASQPEGCVVWEAGGLVFLGEERHGVWSLPLAEPTADPQPVATVANSALVADVEGLAVYNGGESSYLVASSQGNDSYVVFDAAPPHAPRGAFRIALNAVAGIDGASETDGLEVTSADLGGVYGSGLLVVQDGRNRLPDQPQNFKLVPWRAVVETLGLP